MPVRTLRPSPALRASAVIAALALALAGCSSGGGAAAGGAPYGDADIQLSFLKNYEFAGFYKAIDEGYFADEGFGEITLTAGGSSAASAEAQVSTGASFLGVATPLNTAPAILEGAELKIIASDYQRNPFNIVSAVADPIASPDDLVGKTIALGDFNTLVWRAFLAANGIPEGDVDTVPYTDPSQLASGQVDGYLGYTTGFRETIGTNDLPVQEILLADHGLPILAEVIIASQESIDEERDRVQAALTALVRGWKSALDDPEGSVDAVIENYGKDQNFDRDAQFLGFTRQAGLMQTEDTERNGLLTISPELIDQTVETLGFAGIDIEADELFDTSIIDDVYAENPDLT